MRLLYRQDIWPEGQQIPPFRDTSTVDMFTKMREKIHIVLKVEVQSVLRIGFAHNNGRAL